MAQGKLEQNIVIQKNERHRYRICDLYALHDPEKFTLETCDGLVVTIKNMDGETIATLREDSPVTVINKRGYYEVCIMGDGSGVILSIPYSKNCIPED